MEAEAHTLGRLFLHPIHRVFGTVTTPSVHQRCLHRNNVRLSQNMTRTRITFTSVTSAAVCMLFAARLNRIEKKREQKDGLTFCDTANLKMYCCYFKGTPYSMMQSVLYSTGGPVIKLIFATPSQAAQVPHWGTLAEQASRP